MHYVDVYAAQHYTDPNLEQSGRFERKQFRIFLTLTLGLGLNCRCLSEVPHTDPDLEQSGRSEIKQFRIFLSFDFRCWF